MWGVVALTVLATISFSVSNADLQGRNIPTLAIGATPPSITSIPDHIKYPTIDYDAPPEHLTAAEIEERKIKSKRYDVSLTVMPNPPHYADGLTGYDVEPDPRAIPVAESCLVMVGTVTGARAFLSNEKKGIYTEYAVNIERILKADRERKLMPGDVVTADRAGGVVRYSTGQKILYELAGLNFPATNGRYVFFLSNDDPKNPNYKIVTGYRLADGKVTALDQINGHMKFNGTPEAEFLKLIEENVKAEGSYEEWQ